VKALLRARVLIWLRELKSHAFELFVLGPIVFGGALWIADRYVMVGAPYLAGLLAEESGARRFGLLAALAFSALFAAGTFRELYGDRLGVGLLDILPVSEAQRLTLAAVAAGVAALPATLLWTAGGGALTHWIPGAELDLAGALGLSFFALLALVVQGYLLLQLAVRLGLLRALPLALGLAALLGGLIFDPHSLLLLPWRVPGDALAAIWSQASSAGQSAAPLESFFAGLALHLALSSLSAGALFLIYRRRDLDRAQALRGNARALRLLPRAHQAWTALLRRDLLLVLRRFSPLVPIALACSLCLLVLLPLLVLRSGLAAVPLARTFAAGSVLAVAAFVALLPYLLASQLRTFWLESSLGTSGLDFARAKAATALLLAAPAALIAAGLAFVLLPSEAGLTAISILCAALTLSVSMGLTLWETPAEPAIGLIYGLLIGGACAALFVLAPAGWPYWLVAFLYLGSQLLGRVRERVASLERPR